MKTLTSFKATNSVFELDIVNAEKRTSGTITFTYSCAVDILATATEAHKTKRILMDESTVEDTLVFVPMEVVAGLGVLYTTLLTLHNPTPDSIVSLGVERGHVEGIRFLLTHGLTDLERKHEIDVQSSKMPSEHPYIHQFDTDRYIRMKILLLEIKDWLSVQIKSTVID